MCIYIAYKGEKERSGECHADFYRPNKAAEQKARNEPLAQSPKKK